MMFKRLVFVLGVLVLWFVPVTAQDSGTYHYHSDDRAVQFDYPLDWSLENQQVDFNAFYEFLIGTPAAAPFAAAEQSFILVQFINLRTADLPEHLRTAENITDAALDGFAVNTSEAYEFNNRQGQMIDFTTTNERIGRYFAVAINDDWLMHIVLDTSQDNLAPHEAALELIIETIAFDIQIAASEVNATIPVYDIGDIQVSNTLISEDGVASVSYPSDWISEDSTLSSLSGDLGSPPFYTSTFMNSDSTASIDVFIFDTTHGFMNMSANQDTASEFMLDMSQQTNGEVQQFLINNRIATSVAQEIDTYFQQVIAYSLGFENWIVQAIISSQDNPMTYESIAVAMLQSIEFTLDSNIVRTNSDITMQVPDEWYVSGYNISSRNGSQLLFSREVGLGRVVQQEQIEILALPPGAEALQSMPSTAFTSPKHYLEALIQSPALQSYEIIETTIGDYEIAQVTFPTNDGRWVRFITFFTENDELVVRIVAIAPTEAKLGALETVTNELIGGFTITATG